MKQQFPSITGLVDDNPEIIRALGSDYPGQVYLFGQHQKKANFPAFVHLCPTWKDVVETIKSNNIRQ
ncbi:hypothetical protein KW782_03095 [Candidatus Parcubacteria bacterium]|nr:hypothetical protein [Candidatus Parcubacteria bacterium]